MQTLTVTFVTDSQSNFHVAIGNQSRLMVRKKNGVVECRTRQAVIARSDKLGWVIIGYLTVNERQLLSDGFTVVKVLTNEALIASIRARL